MALTVQSIFNSMMVLDNKLDLAAAGDDVARGLIVLNTVTTWLESEAAKTEGLLTTHSTLTTALNTETTAWPATLLRLDALWFIDPTTSRPIFEITPIQGIGNHVPSYGYPWSNFALAGMSQGNGRPREYAASGPGGLFYWAPLPDGVYTIRGYGLWAQADDAFASAASVFPFPLSLRLPFAAMGVELFRAGLDRDLKASMMLGQKQMLRVLKGLARFNHTEPASKVYSEVHLA